MLNWIHQAFNNRPLRRVLFYARFPLALLACYALATQVNPALYYQGLAVSFVGACLQWWCFACLKKQKVIAVNGPYGFVRNPMYLAVAAVIVGQALVLGQPVLLWYAVFFVLGTAAFVYFYEQPALLRQFGDEYRRYCESVPAWLPRVTPYRP